jgi:hypothetical protein
MKKLISLLILILIVSGEIKLLAQKKTIYVKSSQIGTKVESLVEFRGSNGEILKVLDVSSENPYKDRVVSSSDGQVYGYFTQGLLSNETDSAIAISYSQKVFSEGHMQYQDLGESTLLVYDKSGNERFKKVIKADNAAEPLMAPNMKYVGVYFGGLVYDQITRKIEFIIYDLASGSILYTITAPDIAGANVSQDIFIFSIPEGDAKGSRTYYIFDSLTGLLYKKTYELSVGRMIKKFENKGVVFLVPPNSERVESYPEYFTVVKK